MEWHMTGTMIRREKIEWAREMKGKNAAMKLVLYNKYSIASSVSSYV